MSAGTRRARSWWARSALGPAGIQPRRAVTRWTWVSTGKAARPIEKVSTHAAVLGPTPCRLVRYSSTSRSLSPSSLVRSMRPSRPSISARMRWMRGAFWSAMPPEGGEGAPGVDVGGVLRQHRGDQLVDHRQAGLGREGPLLPAQPPLHRANAPPIRQPVHPAHRSPPPQRARAMILGTPYTARMRLYDRAEAERLDREDPLAPLRDRFVIDDPQLIYLDGNSLGRLPRQSLERLRVVVEQEWGRRLIRSWNE